MMAAYPALFVQIKDPKDVAENTRDVSAIAKTWRGAEHRLEPGRFQIEAWLISEMDQKMM